MTRRLLKDVYKPEVLTGLQKESAPVWNDQLDDGASTTLIIANATGTALTTTDAKGNQQVVAYDVAGLLSCSLLALRVAGAGYREIPDVTDH